MKCRVILLTLAAVVVGCTDFTIPTGAQVACRIDDDCPRDFVCRAEVERCIDARIIGKTPIDFSTPPTLTPSRVSTVPGFNTVTVTASLTEEPVGAPSVTVFGNDFSCEGTREIVCTLNVADAGLLEGTFEVRVAARDAAANQAEIVLPLVVDLTPPAVADAPPALLEAALDNPITRPTAIAHGTAARITVSVTELLGVEPTAQLAGTTVALTRLDTDGLADSAFTFGWTFAATDVVAEGPRPVALTLQDAVGNSATVEIDPGLVVDTTPPASPPVEVDNAVVHRRAPWGGVTSETPAFSVVGAAGGEGGLLIEARSSDGPGALILGRGLAGPDGAFDVSLIPVDLPRVFLVAWDPAGNPGPAVRVRDIAWTAAFGSKVVGSRLENPHALFAAPRFSGVSLTPSLTEIDPAPLFTPDVVTVAGGGAWEPRRLNGTSPPTFGNMAFAFHAGLGRVVSFGGAVAGSFVPLDATSIVEGDDVVTLPQDTRPPPGEARMAYDGRRDRLVLVHRRDGSTWVFEDLRWRQVPLSGPAPRRSELAYDPLLDLVVGFESGVVPTTWLFDGVAWTALETPEPGQRDGHVLVWDDVEGRVLLHGGGPGAPESVQGDVWAFTGTTWTQIGVGPALRDHAGFTGPDGTMWVVGGARPFVLENEEIDTNQTVFAWRGTGSGFETITTGPPLPRSLGAQLGAAWDFERDRLVTLGGGTTLNFLVGGVSHEPQMHVFEGGAWRKLDPTQRPPIGSRADLPPLLFDPARGGLIVAGGVILSGAAGLRSDTQLFVGDTVTPVDEDLNTSVGSVFRTAALFRTDAAPMLVANGVAALLSGTGWSPVAATPPVFEGMAAGFLEDDNVAILFGGTNGTAQDGTVRFTTTGGFETLSPAQSPAARHGAAMTWDDGRQRLVLFGGVDGPTTFVDTWTFDGSDWSPLLTSGPSLVEPTLLYDETRDALVLVGTVGDRVVVHELIDDAWQPRAVVGIEGRRAQPASGYDPVGERIVLHGGIGVQGTEDQTFTWDGSPGLRAAVVAQLDLRARGAAAGAVVTALSVDGSAGARGFADATAVPGAQVLLWRGRWEVLGENAADIGAPAALASSSTDPGLLGRLDPDVLHIAVAPGAPNGHRRADVSLGAFAVTLGYREP